MFFKSRAGPHQPVHMGPLSRKKRQAVVLAHISEKALLYVGLDPRKGLPGSAQEMQRAEKSIILTTRKTLDKLQINDIS